MLKKKSFFAAVCFAVLFFGIFSVTRFVHYSGDDYCYLTFLRLNFWEEHLKNYMYNNGRFINHLLLTVFLKLDIRVWYVVNAASVTAVAYFVYRLNRSEATILLILMLPYVITRECVYWMAGACNYVYPALMFVLYWYLLEHGKHNAALYAAAFFAAATIEHTAVAVNVLTFCFIIYSRSENGRFEKKYIYSLIFAVIGALTVLAAPGTIARIGGEDAGGSVGTISASATVIVNNIFGGCNIWLCAIAAALSCVYLWKNKFRILPLLSPLIFLCMYFGNTPQKIDFLSAVQYNIMSKAVIIYCAVLFLSTAVVFYRKNRSATLIFALVTAVCSNIFLIFSPTVGPRVLFLTSVIYTMYISCLLQTEICGKAVYVIITAVICAVAVNSTYTSYAGYRANAKVYIENEELIEQYRAAGGDSLVQHKLVFEDFGWSMPYNSEFHEEYYKIYYDIPQSTKILWE